MAIEIRISKENIDWQKVSAILSSFDLSHDDAKKQESIFKNSYAVAFAYDDNELIGCGRALSDGLVQAAIYNIALDSAYHGKQIGRQIIESLLDQVKGCTVILYTHPQTIALYEKFGFRRQKTGFVMYGNQTDPNWMEEVGFILPERYRFHDNKYENK